MTERPAPYNEEDASKIKRLEHFRIYYNHTIHPELLRMERLRIRLLRLLFFSTLFMLGVLLFGFYINILALTLMLAIPLGGYISYLIYRMQRFRLTFKPNVVSLILDFIDDGMNFDPAISAWNMPELGWKFGYPYALGLMVLCSAGLVAWFYRKGWFR